MRPKILANFDPKGTQIIFHYRKFRHKDFKGRHQLTLKVSDPTNQLTLKVVNPTDQLTLKVFNPKKKDQLTLKVFNPKNRLANPKSI